MACCTGSGLVLESFSHLLPSAMRNATCATVYSVYCNLNVMLNIVSVPNHNITQLYNKEKNTVFKIESLTITYIVEIIVYIEKTNHSSISSNTMV